jgi:hypothetical protein
MATKWKVLEVVGPKMFVLYRHDDGRALVLDLTWDGATDINEALSRINPFPPAAPLRDAPSVVGMEGESKLPAQAPPPPNQGVPQNEGGSSQPRDLQSAPAGDQAGQGQESNMNAPTQPGQQPPSQGDRPPETQRPDQGRPDDQSQGQPPPPPGTRERTDQQAEREPTEEEKKQRQEQERQQEQRR